ncbi:MAG: type II CRISPR-associated endonuclease Cas1, partial [Cyclobacteriaceae bacterium]
MLKRTLFFTNPCRLSVKNAQLTILQDQKPEVTAPIEDLGFVVLEHPQISISLPLLDELATQNVAVIFCNKSHMPHSMLFPLEGNHLQSELYRQQVTMSEPLKKQLWKQTVEMKIQNQGRLLKKFNIANEDILHLAGQVKSGDASGREGVAARKYWKRLFGEDFTRERNG